MYKSSVKSVIVGYLDEEIDHVYLLICINNNRSLLCLISINIHFGHFEFFGLDAWICLHSVHSIKFQDQY